MNIYPKTSENFDGVENLKKYIDMYNGLEIQFFDQEGYASRFEFASTVKKAKEMFKNLDEIIVHPPLKNYDIELLLMKDKKIVLEQIDTLLQLSRELDVKIDMVYHTSWNIIYHEEATVNVLKDIFKKIEGTNVRVLLENLTLLSEETCTVLDLCKKIDNKNVLVCFDLCHMQCRAHIYTTDIVKYAKEYLDKELCKEYVYQVHFAKAINGDGYKDMKRTHGRRHEDYKSLSEDLELLIECGMENANYVTEVSEDDYSTRKDQIVEIENMLKAINS